MAGSDVVLTHVGARSTGTAITRLRCAFPARSTVRLLDLTGWEVFSSAYAVTVTVTESCPGAAPSMVILASTVWSSAS